MQGLRTNEEDNEFHVAFFDVEALISKHFESPYDPIRNVSNLQFSYSVKNSDFCLPIRLRRTVLLVKTNIKKSLLLPNQRLLMPKGSL